LILFFHFICLAACCCSSPQYASLLGSVAVLQNDHQAEWTHLRRRHLLTW
jgi:hypothetical protein